MTDRLPRRSLLALAGLGGAAIAADGPSPFEPPPAGGPVLADRRALAQAASGEGARCLVREGGRTSAWLWQAGDLSARVAADPLAGLTVRHAAIAPRLGAWIRDWDGTHGMPEWFGARADDPAFDNRPAIQAALDLCPAVLLGTGIYHIRGGLRIVRNGTRLIGAGITQTDQGPNRRGTEIVCASPTDTILQVGVDSRTQPDPLVECVQLRDFTVRRAAPPFIPSSGFGGAIGIALRWCVNCHVERIFSIDSARGWFCYGTVENYVRHCSALRAIPGSNRANDFFIGFHLDYSAPLSANGGNASLYLDHCRAFGGFGKGSPSLTYSAGLRTEGGWVDLYLNALETGAVQYGIHGTGDGKREEISFRNEDLIVTNCVLDAATLAAIQLEQGGSATAVQLSNNYCAVAPSGTCIVLRDTGGSISLTANQCITGPPGGTGLSAVNVANLRASANIYTRLRQPVYLEGVRGFHLQDTIRSFDAPNSYPAVTLVNCTRGKVDCIVGGGVGVHGAGVALRGRTSLIEINATNIDPAPIAGGAARKIVSDAGPVLRPGPFGERCLLTGIME